jgi:hypothetical protein
MLQYKAIGLKLLLAKITYPHEPYGDGCFGKEGADNEEARR